MITERKREYMKEYRAKHRKQISESMKEYRQRNRAKLSEYQREYLRERRKLVPIIPAIKVPAVSQYVDHRVNINEEPIQDSEIWMECEEGPWAVSNHGRMVFLTQTGRGSSYRNIGDTVKFRPMTRHGGQVTRNGYLMTTLIGYDGGKCPVVLHRMVAKYFLGERPDGMTVNHIDGDHWNNRADNLEYTSLADNIRQYFRLKAQNA